MKVLAGAATAAAAGGVVAPAIGLGVGAAHAPDLPGRQGASDGDWRAVARWDDLVAGTPVQAHVVGAEIDAWSVSPNRRLGTVWLVRDGEAESSLRAMSAICPHLGCFVEQREGHFFCPCHVSDFDARGRALTGPSPRGLDPIEARVRDGAVEVRWKRYRMGTAARIEEVG